MNKHALPLCYWCDAPVLPEACIILETEGGQKIFLHWECMIEAGKEIKNHGMEL